MTTGVIRRVWMLLAAFCAAHASAVTVTVVLHGEAIPAEVPARFRRVDGIAPPREITLQPGTSDVALEDGTWEMTTHVPGFWSAPAYASPSEGARIELWPGGVISGTVGAGAPRTGELVVRFTAAGADPANVTGPSGTVHCPIADGSWNCSLPAGMFDLLFGLSGFASEFRWGVSIPRQSPVLIGRLDFTPGAALRGRVQLRDRGKRAWKGTEVILTGVSSSSSSATPVRRYVEQPDQRGFFQFKGVAPGSYAIRAASQSLITASRLVEIIANTNAELRDPLVLATPARLSVAIAPPRPPSGDAQWRVQLIESIAGTTRAEVTRQSFASKEGFWFADGLQHGTYDLAIEEADGARWKTEQISIDADRINTSVFVEGQKVAGTVRLGDRPIAATVYFGGEGGRFFEASDQGEFSGVIPTLPDEETTILVTSEKPDIRRTLRMKGRRSDDGRLSYDITLPATTISGRVINEDGTPQPHAIVTLRAPADNAVEQLFSDEDGSFQFFGFPPGQYVLEATSFQKSSGRVDVQAAEEAAVRGVEVVLRSLVQVRGEVVMGSARIGGADVYALPRGAYTSFVPQRTTDQNGLFLLQLPPRTEVFDVIVFARGFSITGARVQYDPEKVLRIEVDQAGGRLHVTVPRSAARPLLVKDGGEFSVAWLAERSGGSISEDGDTRRMTILDLESGAYAVCVLQQCQSVHVPRLASVSVTFN